MRHRARPLERIPHGFYHRSSWAPKAAPLSLSQGARRSLISPHDGRAGCAAYPTCLISVSGRAYPNWGLGAVRCSRPDIERGGAFRNSRCTATVGAFGTVSSSWPVGPWRFASA